MLPVYHLAGFMVCATLIIFSGARLSKYGDIIADLTGIGKAWLGLVLMAAITSLPEMISGFSAIVFVDAPDLAVGDIMGSCAFNLLILAVLDFFVPGKPLSSIVTKGHVVAGFLGIFLLTLSIISILFGSMFPQIGWFSSSSIMMILLFLFAVRLVFRNEQKQTREEKGPTLVHHSEKNIPLNTAISRYILYACIIVGAAIGLPFFAKHISDFTGLNQSFVGTLLIAATTSLPELVVSIAAVKMGSVDIAVGNLLGSNIFNMLILAIDDIVYDKGPLLLMVNPDHALSALVALLMTSVAGISIIYSQPYKRFILGADAMILILLYSFLVTALYYMGG